MLLLEGVRVPTNSTAESKFFSCSWMLHMKRTFLERSKSLKHCCCAAIDPQLTSWSSATAFGPTGHWGSSAFGIFATRWKSSWQLWKEELSSEIYLCSSRSLIYWSKKWYKKTNNVVEKETYITEVRCSKAEKHRHATAVSALRVKSSWDKKRRFWNEPCTPSNLCHA